MNDKECLDKQLVSSAQVISVIQVVIDLEDSRIVELWSLEGDKIAEKKWPTQTQK